MKEVMKVDVAQNEHEERDSRQQDRERADGSVLAACELVAAAPAEEQDRGDPDDEQEELEDGDRREDPAPEGKRQPAARAAARAERLAVSRDRDDREERGDHESEREEAAPDHVRSLSVTRSPLEPCVPQFGRVSSLGHSC